MVQNDVMRLEVKERLRDALNGKADEVLLQLGEPPAAAQALQWEARDRRPREQGPRGRAAEGRREGGGEAQ